MVCCAPRPKHRSEIPGLRIIVTWELLTTHPTIRALSNPSPRGDSSFGREGTYNISMVQYPDSKARHHWASGPLFFGVGSLFVVSTNNI